MTQSVLEPSNYKAVKKPDATVRRVRLRQFQSQLTERVQAARSGADQRNRHLGVMIGNTRCLIDLQQVSEVLVVGNFTKVPLTSDWYLGLLSVRGNLIGVIDFARFQGETPTEVSQDNRIVVFSQALSFNCGLLVSRVLGLRNSAEMVQQPETAHSTIPWLAQRFMDQESTLWTQIDLSLIVQDQRFLNVGL